MKKILFNFLLLICIPLTGHRTVTLKIVEEKPFHYTFSSKEISYKNISTIVFGDLSIPVPPKSSSETVYLNNNEATILNIRFIKNENKDIASPFIIGNYPIVDNSQYQKTGIHIIQAEATIPLTVHLPNSAGSSKNRSYSPLVSHNLVASIKVKIDWNNPAKSTLRVKMFDTIFYKERKYILEGNRHIVSWGDLTGKDYIQDGKYYKWNETKQSWKKKKLKKDLKSR